MAQKKIMIGHVKGDPGEMGKIASATATADATHSESPTVTVDVGGEAGAQTLTFTFTGLQGAPGDKGDTGGWEPSGTTGDIVLGDGTTKSVAEFFTENAEALKTAIGVATTSSNGLLPQLPADPNVA